MAMYKARWTDPVSGRPKYRDFHTRADAKRFRDLPRDNLVFIEPYKKGPAELAGRGGSNA